MSKSKQVKRASCALGAALAGILAGTALTATPSLAGETSETEANGCNAANGCSAEQKQADAKRAEDAAKKSSAPAEESDANGCNSANGCAAEANAVK